MNRRVKIKRWGARGVFPALGMLTGGLLLALIFPVVRETVSATDCTATSDPSSPVCQMSTSVNTNLTTLIRSSIAVALSSEVELDVTPKSTGTFSTSEASLKVTTNNTTGYAVYMQTADDTSELKATNPHVEASIGPVVGVMTSGSYATNLNTWGYAVSEASAASNAEYKAVPRAGEEAIVRTTGISQEDDYNLSFAVAVGSDLPAGLYTNQLVVSVVANPIEVRSLNDITYMQDMTSEICNITFEGETKQLIDSRDGKSYWVAKLKDGNCWMVQNLALDIALDNEGNAAALSENGTKVTLDGSNSDMSGKWGSESENPPRLTQIGSTGTEVMLQSWNLGKYVFKEPAVLQDCGSQGGDNPLSACSVSGFVEVLGWMAYNTESQVIVDEGNRKYDAHYLVGNYYTFIGATAGGTNGDTMSSVCPKGWRLPRTGKITGNFPSQSSDFYKLLLAYGYPSADAYGIDQWGNPYISQSRGASEDFWGAPNYFVRTGRLIGGVDSGEWRLSNAGVDFDFWSSSTVNATYSATMRILAKQNFYPFFAVTQTVGDPVRCIAE